MLVGVTPATESSHGPRNRRGTVTVEFAICASLIFLMFFGMLEMARFHVVRHTLDQASYEGARAGIIPGATATDARDAANQVLSGGGIVNATVEVVPGTIDQTTANVTVRVRANYSDNSWATPKYFAGQEIVAATTLDHENVASQGGGLAQ